MTGEPSNWGRAASPPPAQPALLRTETILLAIALGVLTWLIGSVLLMVFAGIVLGVAIDGLAQGMTRHTRLPRGWSVVLVIFGLLGLLAAGVATIVPQFMQQFGQLLDRLSELGAQALQAAQQYPWLSQVLGAEGNDEPAVNAVDLLGPLASATFTTLGAIGSLILVIVIGLFAAVDPELYRHGLVKLVPLHYRPRAKETLSKIGYALRWWLLGQLIAMIMLGVSTAIGLFLIGVELWLSLAVLVALLAFIPFLGPIIAGIPVVLIAFTEGMEIGFAVLAFYIVLQNVEGNILTPMIQQRAIRLPPVLLISMQILFGVLFGAVGLILASPLAVVLMVVVNLLYIEDVLGDRSDV